MYSQSVRPSSLWRVLFSLILSLAVLLSRVHAKVGEGIEEIGGNLPVFIEFFAPWCGHCKALAPEWQILEQTFSSSNKVVVSHLDADANPEQAKRFEVSGYPTLLFFPSGTSDTADAESYNGERTAKAMTSFLNEKTGSKVFISTPKTAVRVLNDETKFFETVGTSKSGVFVEFFAPWCGHCKKIAPNYELAAASFVGDEDRVIVASVDATQSRNLAEKYDISGYPSLRWFAPGNKDSPEMYIGKREPIDFVSFINEKMGTKREVGGGYIPGASSTPELNAAIKEFYEASDADKPAVIEKATEAGKNVETPYASVGRFYALTMKKIMQNADYVKMEFARLERMLSSGSITNEKISSFRLRQSILASFDPAVVKGKEDEDENEKEEL